MSPKSLTFIDSSLSTMRNHFSCCNIQIRLFFTCSSYQNLATSSASRQKNNILNLEDLDPNGVSLRSGLPSNINCSKYESGDDYYEKRFAKLQLT